MGLLLMISLSLFVAFVLFSISPLLFAVAASSVIIGCLFRIISLLQELVPELAVRKTEAQEELDRYLTERDGLRK